MYAITALRVVLIAGLILAAGAPQGHARAADADVIRARERSAIRRLRPLEMNYRSRAHIRGVLSNRGARKRLMAEVRRREGRYSPAWTPELPASTARRPRVRQRPTRVTPRPTVRTKAAAGRPSRPLLRRGVGYPLPPWLRGIRLPDIGIRFSSQVYRYLRYYRTNPVGRQVLRHWLGKMKRYESLIRAELRRHGLPQSLIYVAMIESSFRPTTVSRAGAAGLWQFMPYGGNIYGLKRTFWVDERFNPDRATRAVMYYFKDLFRRFGNWEMALAAYNAGYGGMMRAVRKYNTNDYWRLCEYEAGMPYETMAYVPKFFAIAVVAENLDRFGLTPRRPATPWEYALVTVRGGTTIRRIAQLARVPVKTLKALNPELRRNRVPPGANYELRIPVNAQIVYQRAAAVVRAGTRNLQPYRVRYGDSMSSIAQQFGISTSLLRRLNRIRHRREVRPGVTLLVPVGRTRQARRAARNNRQLVPLPEAKAPSPSHQAIYYPVVTGDRMADVARALGVPLHDLLAWNTATTSTRLLSGMVLRAFVKRGRRPKGVRLLDPASLQVVPANSTAFHQAYLRKRHRRRLVIRARAGDTMKRIARRYSISVGSLARENKLSRRAKLRPGQRVVVYTRGRKRRRPRRHRRRRRRSR